LVKTLVSFSSSSDSLVLKMASAIPARTEVNTHIEKAEILTDQEDWKAALEEYKLALEIMTRGGTSWDLNKRIYHVKWEVAACLLHLEQYQDAIIQCDEILRQTSLLPIKMITYVRRARVFMASSHYESALQSLNEAERLLPKIKVLEIPKGTLYLLYSRRATVYLHLDEQKYHKEAEADYLHAIEEANHPKDKSKERTKLKALQKRFKLKESEVAEKKQNGNLLKPMQNQKQTKTDIKINSTMVSELQSQLKSAIDLLLDIQSKLNKLNEETSSTPPNSTLSSPNLKPMNLSPVVVVTTDALDHVAIIPTTSK